MLFIQRCVNTKRSESRGGIPHVPLADLRISPKGNPSTVSESCFLFSGSCAGSSASLQVERRHLATRAQAY